MTTALDSNILIDILYNDSEFYSSSYDALHHALRRADVVVSEPVCAEIAANFEDGSSLQAFLSSFEVSLVPSSPAALHRAGQAFRSYLLQRKPLRCPDCSATLDFRRHIVADFMIGAHALVHAERLLTRDRGYFRTYFPELELV